MLAVRVIFPGRPAFKNELEGEQSQDRRSLVTERLTYAGRFLIRIFKKNYIVKGIFKWIVKFD